MRLRRIFAAPADALGLSRAARSEASRQLCGWPSSPTATLDGLLLSGFLYRVLFGTPVVGKPVIVRIGQQHMGSRRVICNPPRADFTGGPAVYFFIERSINRIHGPVRDRLIFNHSQKRGANVRARFERDTSHDRPRGFSLANLMNTPNRDDTAAAVQELMASLVGAHIDVSVYVDRAPPAEYRSTGSSRLIRPGGALISVEMIGPDGLGANERPLLARGEAHAWCSDEIVSAVRRAAERIMRAHPAWRRQSH